MAGEHSLTKEFHSLMKHIRKFSDGQATITEWDEESLSWFRVMIEPNDGLYKDAEFEFEIDTLTNGDYPETAPRITCRTGIYHPNIDTIAQPEGDVCLNLLDELWTQECTLEDVIMGLLFLLYNPNIEDPLCSIITPDLVLEEFEENVARSLAGKDIDGEHYFDPNPKYARLHPDECHRAEEEEEVKKEDAGEAKEKEEDEFKDGQIDGVVIENVSHVEEDEKREQQETCVFVSAEENMNDPLEKCREARHIDECRNECEQMKVENAEEAREHNDITDNDVVSDEDLERIVDERTFVEEANRRNEGGATSDSHVSWSNMVYGNDAKFSVDVAPLCEQCTTADCRPLMVWGCTVCQQRTSNYCSKDTICTGLRIRSERTPTVTSLFFTALQTRGFRRWIL